MTVTNEPLYKIKFGVRELFYISLCITLGYVLRVKDSYSLTPVWRKRSEFTKFANGKFPTDADRLPSPTITDLDGDGINEVVLVSNDLQHLNILAMPTDLDNSDRALAHVVVKNKADLVLARRLDDHIPRPYSVGVGFTTPYQSMVQMRKQIIVVVSDDWQILCFNSELKLLWTQKLPLPAVSLTSVEVKSLAVHVSPFTIEKKHKGLVVVAGNFKHKTHKPDLFAEIKEREENRGPNRTIQARTEEENETLTHFSTFALSAEDGTLLWKHTSEDFQQETETKHMEEKIHWKLTLKRKLRHRQESPWAEYQDQLKQFLPHMWADNSDTQISVIRADRQFDGSGKQTEETPESTTVTPPALRPEHFIGFSYGGKKPHASYEHISNPNSVVIRSPEGLQVMSIVTGEPKTSYRFPADRALYLDMDKDGHLEKLVWDLGQHFSPCFFDVWRLQPVQEKLEQIPLCTTKRLFWTRSWSQEEDTYKKISPKVIKSTARKTGVLRHFLGHNLFEDNSYDVITFGSLGKVSSIGMDGTIYWQTLTESKWSDLSLNMRRSGGRPVPDHIKEEFLLSFQPSRALMPLVEGEPTAAIAVAGWSSLSVVDLHEGNLLAEHSIPSPPTGPLVIGDFDNDGLMDIVLTCKKGYIGFSLKLEHNYNLTVLYTVSVFLVIVLFSWLISISFQEDNDSDADKDDLEDFTFDPEDEQVIVSGDDDIREITSGYS